MCEAGDGGLNGITKGSRVTAGNYFTHRVSSRSSSNRSTTITAKFGCLVSWIITKLRITHLVLKACISGYQSRVLKQFINDGNERFAEVVQTSLMVSPTLLEDVY